MNIQGLIVFLRGLEVRNRNRVRFKLYTAVLGRAPSNQPSKVQRSEEFLRSCDSLYRGP